MTHFIGGPSHGTPVSPKLRNVYRILVGRVHYIRRVSTCGRVDFVIYGMLDTHVDALLHEIYSTEDV